MFEKGFDDNNFKFNVHIKTGQYDGTETTQILGPSMVKNLYNNLRKTK